ncbi:MAG: sigma factor [Planctomycetota bacterium]|jgi:DNA-directed RNA polymerase specialized sigma24 family protein
MVTISDDNAPLTPGQRVMVQQNLGLIAVHLRRRVPGLTQPRREREWDDLFQEGFLGLVRAARVFDENRGIPFAAFALSRINHAVDRAIRTRFSILPVPSRKRRGTQEEKTHAGQPRCFSIHDGGGAVRHVEDSSCSNGGDIADGARETLGCRIRRKYERAVEAATHGMSDGKNARRDYAQLVRTLVEKRFLIPDEHRHPSLREIARITGSSYGRVAACNRRITESIRRQLEHDPEFEALQKTCSESPLGVRQPIDRTVEARLQQVGNEIFIRRIRSSDPARLGHLLHTLMQLLPKPTDSFIRECIRHLSPNLREGLFTECLA